MWDRSLSSPVISATLKQFSVSPDSASVVVFHVLAQGLFQCWESSINLHWIGELEWQLNSLWGQLSTKGGTELEKKCSSLHFLQMDTSGGIIYVSQRSCGTALLLASLTYPYYCQSSSLTHSLHSFTTAF